MPPKERLEGESNLKEEKVCFALPTGQRAKAGHRTETQAAPTGPLGSQVEGSCFTQHRLDGQFTGTGTDLGFIASYEKELVNAIGFGGQQVSLKAEQVSVSGVQAGD